MKKYRIIIYTIIAILLVSVGVIASATIETGSFTDDNGRDFTYTYNQMNNNLHIGGSGAVNFSISADHTALPWYTWRNDIKSISVDSSIIQLGYGMFRDCTALTDINIPGTVLYIQPEAFAGCSALTKATIGEGTLTIADRVFTNCGNLSEISLPSTIVGLGSEFISGTRIKELTLQDKLTVILPKKIGAPGATFGGCDPALTVNAMQMSYAAEWLSDAGLNAAGIPYYIYKPNGTFADKEGNAESIKWELDVETATLTISDITDIGTANMPDYTEAKYTPWYTHYGKYTTVIISSGITRIGNRTFQSDSQTQKVYIPATVTAYGTYLFNGTSQLTEIVFEEGTKSLNYASVINNNNANLKQLTIPKSVTTIHSGFFLNVDNKERVKELTINVYRNTAGHDWAKMLKSKNDVVRINILD